jgi:hypothetical protein
VLQMVRAFSECLTRTLIIGEFRLMSNHLGPGPLCRVATGARGPPLLLMRSRHT